MFLKPFRVKTNTALKSSDRKKLKQDVVTQNPGITPEQADDLFPAKAEVSVAKVQTQAKGLATVYLVEGVPLFFLMGKEKSGEKLLPTVYAAWKCPVLAPRPMFYTHSPVVKKLQGGADLMIPGLVLPKGAQGIGPKTFGMFMKGTPCSVATSDNAAIVAIGTTALDNEDMYMSAGHGKGIVIAHVLGDHLWEMGSKTPRPNLGPPADIGPFEETSDDEDIGSGDEVEEKEEGEDGEESEEEEDSEAEDLADQVEKVAINDKPPAVTDSQPQQEEPMAQEDLLMHCLLKSLKTTAKKLELPCLTSNFFRMHMIPACPDGRILDVKKSRFKKLSVFLREALVVYPGLMKIEETAKGVESIVAIDYSNEGLRKFRFDPSETTAAPPPSDATGDSSKVSLRYNPPEIVELHSVTAAVLPLLKGRSKGQALSTAEIREGLVEYVKENELNKSADKKVVGLDPVLASVVLRKGENNLFSMQWAEVISRTLQKMTPAYKLAFSGQEPIYKKGAVPSVNFNVLTRAGNKKVTVITGVTELGLDIGQVSKCIQHGVATSASIGQTVEGYPQITVMGDQRKFLSKLFIDDLKMPRKYLKGLDTPAKGKK